jgi:WD40 repeat protein
MNERRTVAVPFPGLRSFEPDEVDLFFGREEQIDELLSRLQDTRFIAVLGTSGSGKSSLVRAGLLPSLYGGFMTDAGSTWHIGIMQPGSDPLGNLAQTLSDTDIFSENLDEELATAHSMIIESTLRSSHQGLVEAVQQTRMPADENYLLLVDQFEELFHFKQSADIATREQEAFHFTQLLIAASQQQQVSLYIVITMRSDFLGDCAQLPDLAGAINDGMYLVPRMVREERRLAITGPVAVAGANISSPLVIKLLNNVGNNFDNLPVLQHLLMCTWNYWQEHQEDGQSLDLIHYEAVGGISEALSLDAEKAFQELPNERSKEVAEKLFKRLTLRGPDGRGVRSPTTMGEISESIEASMEEISEVVERFRHPSRSYLRPSVGVPLQGDTVIDISHESLMRNWQRLIGWVREESRSADTYLELSETASLYQQGQRGFVTNPELQLYLNWQRRTQPNEAWARRYDPAFERATVYLRASAEDHESKIAHEAFLHRRKLKRARIFALVMGSTLFLCLTLIAYALISQSELATAREKAQEAKIEAEVALGEAEKAKEEAEQLNAQTAVLQRQKVESERELKDQQQRMADLGRREVVLKDQLARIQADQQLQLGKIDSLNRAQVQLETAIEENERQNAQLQASVVRIQETADALNRLSTARRLALQALKTESEELRGLLGLQAFLFHTRNGGSPQDPLIYNALQLDGGEVLRGHQDAVRVVRFSPDGSLLASAGDDGIVNLWQSETQERKTTLEVGQTGRIRTLDFSPDGRSLVAGTVAGQVLNWQLNEPDKGFQNLSAASDLVQQVTFAEQGEFLAAGYRSGTVQIWRREQGIEPKSLYGELQLGEGQAQTLSFIAGNGDLLATGGEDGIVYLWDPHQAAEKPISQLQAGGPVLALISSADGRLLAAGTRTGDILVWEFAEAGKNIVSVHTLRGHTSSVTDLAFDPSDRLLASCSLDQTVRIWDTRQPEDEAIVLEGHGDWVWSVSFSPDGRTIASGSADQTARLWVAQAELLAARAAARLERNMTQLEWEKFIGSAIEYQKTLPNLPAGK